MEVDYIQHCGSDLTIVNAARVSFDKESKWETVPQQQGERFWLLSDKDKKLVHYLADHEHTSPFNHAFITMRVKAPIFVARQLVKHKFMPWNEISRRYVDSEPEFYEPEVWRYKTEDKKQGSSDKGASNIALEMHYVHHDPQSVNGSMRSPKDAREDALIEYRYLIDELDICPEQARMVLPQSMYTEWYWSGTLGAWLDMLKLRLKPDTQQETREVAQMCADIIKPLFPVAYEARLNKSLDKDDTSNV